MNSQNGTWVDGQRTQMTELHQDVCIVAGRTVFMFGNHLPGFGTAVAKPQAVLPGTRSILPAALAS